MVAEEVVLQPLSSGFFVNIFWAAAANVVFEWPPSPYLGLMFKDPVREVREAAMVGSEVLGGRRQLEELEERRIVVVLAAATALAVPVFLPIQPQGPS